MRKKLIFIITFLAFLLMPFNAEAKELTINLKYEEETGNYILDKITSEVQ